jgi:predicted metalloprotease with PDZ domain
LTLSVQFSLGLIVAPMLRLPLFTRLFTLLVCTFAAGAAAAQTIPSAPPVSDRRYAGEITLNVDATDLDRKVMRVQQTLPVQPGPLQLYFPRWLPGWHSPGGDVTRLAGLVITSNTGQRLAWTRDALDAHLLRLAVPAGVNRLELQFQSLTPVQRDSGRVVMTREMMNVQWEALVLYPAGFAARNVTVKPSLMLPAGWQYGTALRPVAAAGAAGGTGNRTSSNTTAEFRAVSLETLIDSPVFAGRHVRRFELDAPGTPRPVALTLMADRADWLKASDAQIEAHRELVRQSDRLFGARHFNQYDFLLAISEEMGGIGLEHHESSENGVRAGYFENWDKSRGARELLPHEYVHSWNGKFRRPSGLMTPHYNLPMQNNLLWVYEGQTQFWGWVLAARSGLVNAELSREQLARIAADLGERSGRAWRNLQDTTEDPIMSARRGRKDWWDWQRGGDYYNEALLIWLDADTLMRERTAGAKSMDDFARAFFGIDDGQLGPKAYRFEDVVATLNAVMPHDWASFLRERLDAHDKAPLEGLARSGWRLAFADTPSEDQKAREALDKFSDFTWSLGVSVSQEGRLTSVKWGGAAHAAGLAPGPTLLAVNQRAYKAEDLRAAIAANKDGSAPVELLLRDGDLYRTVRIDVRGGVRYPRLARIEGSEDRLSPLLAPKR